MVMRAFLVALFCTSLLTSGCTIVGTAVGASTPRYEATARPLSDIEIGTRVRVRLRVIGADAAGIAEVHGRYGGIRDGIVSVLDADGRERELPAQDVVDLDVENGTEWRKGLLLGAAADLILVAAGVAIANGANVSIATGH
jgi:hypothetical protein